MTNKRKILVSVAALILFLGLFIAIFFLVGRPMIRYAGDPAMFRAYVDGHGFTGRLLFIGMILLQVVVAIIPGEPFELLAGYAFGAVEGTILCLIASFIGGLLVFFLVRVFGMKLVRVFFSEEKINRLTFLKTTPKRSLLYFLIFMVPGTPKDILCYFAGLTDMRIGAWLIISSLGRIPSIITSTVLADALGTEKYLFAILAFVITALLSTGGFLLYYRILSKGNDSQRISFQASKVDK